jgi:uncharacterized protein (DUF1501 family)
MDKHSRRDFLIATGSLIAVGLAAPSWLGYAARAAVERRARGLSAGGGRVLVVCQLSGGNDGLNTVIPFRDAAYYAARPELAIARDRALPISPDFALHPALENFKALYEAGQVAIVNGVGYDNPNRSHFASMSIWHTADPGQQQKYGWLGRYLDTRPAGNPVLALNLGNGRIEALQGAASAVPAFASLEDIRSLGGDEDAERALRSLQQGQGELSVPSQATTTALDAMDKLASVLDSYTPTGKYADDTFGQGFRQIEHLLAVSPDTQIVYFAAGGFDTHAGQLERQAELLKGYSDALSEFTAAMQRLGRGPDVTVLTFSEFGRRVSENASQGTDHGKAGPVFVCGAGVKGKTTDGLRDGFFGGQPSLSDLSDGDLKHNTDFRRVYASLLTEWLGADAAAILGQDYQPLGLFV